VDVLQNHYFLHGVLVNVYGNMSSFDLQPSLDAFGGWDQQDPQ
jgi:hypothetical protein